MKRLILKHFDAIERAVNVAILSMFILSVTLLSFTVIINLVRYFFP